MNRRARELGLTATHYANPHGLDAAGHHSSVRDLVTLARVAMRNPVFRETVSHRRASIPGPGGVGTRDYVSENLLLDIDPDVDGVKTGMTDGAGYALVAHARRRPESPELYAALIGAPSASARAREGQTAARLRPLPVRDGDPDPGGRGLRERARWTTGPGRPCPTARPPRSSRRCASGEPVTETVDGPARDRRAGRRGRRSSAASRCARASACWAARDLVAAESAGEPSVWDRVRAGRRGARAVIVTVTLNAALDRTVRVPNFQLGGRHRADSSLRLPGGKGVNVARALKALGQPVIATGLAGGRTGLHIIEELTAEGILNDFVRIADESRTSTAVIDPTNNQQTEINEYGPSVQPAELDVLIDKIRYLSKGADVFVLAGSLPRDVPSGYYETLLRELRRVKMITAVDASGPALRAALAAEPGVVSPNVREAEEIVGHEFGDEEDMAAAVGTIAQMGAETALIHHEDGCVAHVRTGPRKRGHTFAARLPARADVVSTVGSGDAFLAGYSGRALRPPAGRGVPGPGGRVRRREHPALRRGRPRPVRRRVADAAGRGRPARLRPSGRERR